MFSWFTSVRHAAAATSAVMLALAAPATPGAAANMCTERQKMVSALSNKYKEARRGLGIASRTGVMEFYVSPAGTWTVLMTMPNGVSCIVAAGRDWEEIAVTPTGTNS